MPALPPLAPRRSSTLGALGTAYLSLSAWMFSQETAMRRSGGPGIVGLELAGSAEEAERIVAAWGPEGRAAARRSLLIDYGVLASYGPLMAGLCLRSQTRLGRRGARLLPRFGAALACAQMLAAIFDAGENTVLLAVLAGRRGGLPAIARRSAILKFSLLAIGLAYVMLGLGPCSPAPRRPSLQ